jgi:hypothetical protein
MSAVRSLSRDERTQRGHGEIDAFDPERKEGPYGAKLDRRRPLPVLWARIAIGNGKRTRPFRAGELESTVFQWVTAGRQWHES